MRLKSLAAAGLLATSLAAHADQINTYDITGTTSDGFFGEFQDGSGNPDVIFHTYDFSGTVQYDATTFTLFDFKIKGFLEHLPLANYVQPFDEIDSCILIQYCYVGQAAYYTDDPTDGITFTSFDLFPDDAIIDGKEASGRASYQLNGFATPQITPEPSTFALLGTGLLGMTGVIKRRSIRLGEEKRVIGLDAPATH